jgi:hypothetical protein
MSAKGVAVVHLDGWNGSFHDPFYWQSARCDVLVATSRRAGWMGRLRHAAQKCLPGQRAMAEEVVQAATLVRKGIWREGD